MDEERVAARDDGGDDGDGDGHEEGLGVLWSLLLAMKVANVSAYD